MRTRWLLIGIGLLVGVVAIVAVACGDDDEIESPVFFEAVPFHRMVDLSVSDLEIAPERADPGEQVTVNASVSNLGPADSRVAALNLLVDDIPIGVVEIPPLDSDDSVELSAVWTAAGPGRHRVIAQISANERDHDAGQDNDIEIATARVSGEAVPEQELEFSDIDLNSLQQAPDGSTIITLQVRNPSFAEISNIPLQFFFDGEPVSEGTIEFLAPGDRQQFEIAMDEVAPGQHVVALEADLPEEFLDAEFERVKAWQIVVPNRTTTYSSLVTDEWVPIGPTLLIEGDDSVSRMDTIAFDLSNVNTLYAGAPAGGVWKSTDRGANWKPVGDELPALTVRAVAVDPKNPQIVYAATQKQGVFKSIDGGQTWGGSGSFVAQPFASPSVLGGGHVTRKEFVIRYETSQVVIYLATNRGLWRYTSMDPKARTSTAAEWVRIKTGNIDDIAVHPTDNSQLYASVNKSGLWRTTVGATATGDSSWTPLGTSQGLPAYTNKRQVLLDIYEKHPDTVYAAITKPLSGVDPWVSVWRSADAGDSWKELESHRVGNNGYQEFIRIDPNDENVYYFGGIKLYKRAPRSKPSAPLTTRVRGVHDDMKSLVFDPFDSDLYYVLSDGGIWRCRSELNKSDTCAHRNKGLQTTLFFDFDSSDTRSDLMIGGTQDNGTILWENRNPVWRLIKGGDGATSLIASADNKILIAQHQWLDSTVLCDSGPRCTGNKKGVKWIPAKAGLPTGGNPWASGLGGGGNTFITKYPIAAPGTPDLPGFSVPLLSQGDQVYFSGDGKSAWIPVGPDTRTIARSDPPLRGVVTRIAIQPVSTGWVAGTERGQLWYKRSIFDLWHLIRIPMKSGGNAGGEHRDGARVESLAFAPTNENELYVTFSDRADDSRRIYQFTMREIGCCDVGWDASNITGDLPKNLTARVVSGDGHTDSIVYVGTSSGGVWKRDTSAPLLGPFTIVSWKPYNDGLPSAVDVRDLLVDPTSKELRVATWGRGAWSVITGP